VLKGSNTAKLGMTGSVVPLLVLLIWAVCRAAGVVLSGPDYDLLAIVAEWGAGAAAVGAGANSLRHVGEGWRPAQSSGGET